MANTLFCGPAWARSTDIVIMTIYKLRRRASAKRRLVFAPTKYLDREFLHRYRIDFQQLPFQIYEAIDGLER